MKEEPANNIGLLLFQMSNSRYVLTTLSLLTECALLKMPIWAQNNDFAARGNANSAISVCKTCYRITNMAFILFFFFSFMSKNKQCSLFTWIHHRLVASGFFILIFFPLFILQIWDVTGAQHREDCACNYEKLRIKSECFLSAHSALLVNTLYVYSCSFTSLYIFVIYSYK